MLVRNALPSDWSASNSLTGRGCHGLTNETVVEQFYIAFERRVCYNSATAFQCVEEGIIVSLLSLLGRYKLEMILSTAMAKIPFKTQVLITCA